MVEQEDSTPRAHCNSCYTRLFLTTKWNVAAVVVLSVTAIPRSARAETVITVKDIASTWAQRDRQCSTVSVKWTERKFVARGGLARKGAGSYSSGGAHQHTDDIPSEDVVHVYRREVILRGDDLWYSHQEPAWLGDKDKWVERNVSREFKNGKFRSLSEMQADVAFPLTGSVDQSPERITGMAVIKPIIVHFRPSRCKAVARLKEEYILTNQRRAFDESQCAILVAQSNRHSNTKSLWVDVNRGFLVRRWLSELNGRVLEERNIYYRADPDGGDMFVPTEWKFAMYWPDGTLQMQFQAEDVQCKVNDPQIDLPTVEFPEYTLVTDHTESGEGPEARTYLVLDGGKRRPVKRDELQRPVTPDLLARTAPGEALASEVPARMFLIWALGGCALVAIIAWALFRLVLN